jgi:DNA modification methylase
MIDLNRIYNMDCLEGMKRIPDGFVDLTVTSPPYDNLRTYNGNIEQWSFEKFQAIAKELYRITADGGVVVWVVNDATIKGSETGTSFRQALYFKEIGFNLHDTMIYKKAQACFGSNLCYLQSFEYMFVLSKGRPKSINFLRDRPNVRYGKEKMAKQGLSVDGEKAERVYKDMKKMGKRKNIWTYGVGGGSTGHPAVFPEQLAQDHILSWSNEGDIVLDPFIGSGTTAIACINTNRNYIGFELDKQYFDIAQQRISTHPQPITGKVITT